MMSDKFIEVEFFGGPMDGRSSKVANGVTHVVVPALMEPLEVVNRERGRVADVAVAMERYSVGVYKIVFAVHESMTTEEVCSELKRRLKQRHTPSPMDSGNLYAWRRHFRAIRCAARAKSPFDFVAWILGYIKQMEKQKCDPG